MWEIGEVKARGKAAFKANYWYSVLAGFILTICVGGVSSSSSQSAQNEEVQAAFQNLSPQIIAVIFGAVGLALIVAIAVDICLLNPLEVGCHYFFLKNIRETPANISEIKEGFKNIGHKIGTMFLKDLFLVLWFMLFCIPGFIKYYSYMMVPYILAENPDLSATEVITRSRQMMNGHKWKAFVLDLSFIGWILLTAFTCGLVGIFWTMPYVASTKAALYEAIKGEATVAE